MILDLVLSDIGNKIEIIIAILVIGLAVISTIAIVPQQRVFVIERLGKFNRSARPGLALLIPFVDRVAMRLDMRIESIEVEVSTITKDKVPTTVKVAVQRFVLPDQPEDAFYKQVDPDVQIKSYIFDVVRTRVPQLTLDQVYDNKDEIAKAVKSQLTEKKAGEDRVIMKELGFGIATTLVTDIDPDEKVKAAMAEINENKRKKEAAIEKAAAYLVLRNARSDADMYQKQKSGEGYAAKRKAITNGLKESTEQLHIAMPQLDDQQLTNILLITEYFDMNKDMARGAGRVIFQNASVEGFGSARDALQAALFGAEVEPDKEIEKVQVNRETADPGAEEIKDLEGEMTKDEQELMEGTEMT